MSPSKSSAPKKRRPAPPAGNASLERKSFRRAAIVTGGAGKGIGHGITEALVSNDWAVLIVDRDAAQAGALKNKLRQQGGQVEILVADITAPRVPDRAVKAAMKAFGRVDGLVNNAGVGLCKPLAEATDAEFEHLLDVDLRAAFRFSREVISVMLSAGGGAIVNIGSVHAHKSLAGYGLYGCIKAGLEGLARAIAIDYGARGIRANSVHPGYVESPQNRTLISRFTSDPEAWIARYATTKQLLPSIVTARQVGDLVAWLLCAKSATITGQAFTIDSGSSTMLYEREKEVRP